MNAMKVKGRRFSHRLDYNRLDMNNIYSIYNKNIYSLFIYLPVEYWFKNIYEYFINCKC